MIRSVLVASCDHCGIGFGPKRSDGVAMVHWSEIGELFYALGRDGWGVLFGDTGEQISVMCSNCRQGGEE